MKHLLSLVLLCSSLLLNSQEWFPATSLPLDFQTHHSFAFGLEDMGYIVAGGSEVGERGEFYQYDPSFDWWVQLDDFPGAPRGFAIGDVWDGKAYFGFGYDGSVDLNDLWVFDPSTLAWTELASCPCEGRSHPTFVAHNDKVFVGLGSGNGNLKDWWEYDIASDTWSQKPDFPATERHHPYQFGIGEYIYTGFGHGDDFISNEWFRYDPSNESWDQVASLPAEGRVAGTQFSYGDKGYALSGDGDDHTSMQEGEFWEYDPSNDSWTSMPPHPGKSRWALSSFLIGSKVYIINGTNFAFNTGEVYRRECYFYDLNPDTTPTDEIDELELTLYPNPTSDFIKIGHAEKINVSSFALKIYNVKGQVVFVSTTQQNEYNISILPQGQYLVEIITDTNNYRQLISKI